MKEFLINLGFSEGIAETIIWWLPSLSLFVAVIAIVIIVRLFAKRKNKK